MTGFKKIVLLLGICQLVFLLGSSSSACPSPCVPYSEKDKHPAYCIICAAKPAQNQAQYSTGKIKRHAWARLSKVKREEVY